ncbi:methylenetetrahydrofolate reductase (NADPH) [Kineococcus xinjiangensis]|uniref:Methylenetetrahydrofolate reductase n=1 Tax=Kineococcus xinjiangensis TaxID=512762 RepID=A0A2S6ISS0_9ACTN|nr:methylenetetrahydrofolate reductase [Kineococcus xinjiangensis]PPK97278.1 methylenetetrahydrofolate reductase (NADPH) [Kineococcus xinjiangensis]
MSVARLLTAGGRPTVSFELFPPRTPAATESLHRTVEALSGIGPDFLSVTYGASGSTRETSRDLVRHVLSTTPVPVVAHLTCVGASRAQVIETATEFLDVGVRSFLALRGDPPAGRPDWQPHPDGVARACDLVELLQVVERRHRAQRRPGRPVDDGPLSIAVAAFPAAAPAPSGPDDVEVLLAKQRAGADFAITQVFYDARDYVRFADRARAAGVTIPLLPGIIPLTDPGRLLRLQGLTGVPVPRELLARLESAADGGERAVHAEGIRASVELARRILDAGAPGLHVYTFNKHHAALDLLEGVHLGGGAPTAPDLASRPWVSAPHHDMLRSAQH